jgi:dUTP pyrophosphatase
MSQQIFIKRLTNYAEVAPAPPLLSSGRALSLHAATAGVVVLAPKERMAIPTGLSMEMPIGYEAQILTDSHLAADSGIVVLNSPGTIDADYRGEVMVILYNHGNADFEVRPGTKIADMRVRSYAQVQFQEVDELPPSSRGAGGLGSTGSR